MSTDVELIMGGRLLLASALGALIGLEREIHGRTAGFRTHLLVSLGAALFVVVSINFHFAYGNFSGAGPVGVDPGRVAAQVVTGIGFLGAGAIIHEKTSVRGLTTAACLWIAAAIGVACGSGLYLLSVVVTCIAIVSLVALKKIEAGLSRDNYAMLTIETERLEGQLEKITTMVESHGFKLMPVGMECRADGSLLYEFQVKMHHRIMSSEEIDQIGLMTGIRGVKLRRQAVV